MKDFLRAASCGDLPGLIKCVMKGTIDVNEADDDGLTALHYACMQNNQVLLRFLLRRKDLDIQLQDKRGRTALECTPEKHLTAVSILFSKAKATAYQHRQRETRPEVENEEMLEETDIKEADIVSPATLRQSLICLLLPFLFLIVYNGFLFAAKFIAVSLTFYYIALGYFISEISIRPPWYHHQPKAVQLTRRRCPEYWQGWIQDPRTDFGLDYEEVTFGSSDHYTLKGWYVFPPGSSRRELGLVMVHGGGRDRRAWLRHVPFLHKAGYGCLLFDLREHGLSDGNMRGFTFGMKERYDVIAAARFMRTKYGYTRVGAIGTSVGGSSVIMAAAIDSMIDVVIAENAITTSETLLDQQLVTTIGGYFAQRAYSLLFFRLFRRVCILWHNVRIGNKPSKNCQALHCIDGIAPRPILVMHGTVDSLVPMKHSQILFEAAKEPKQLYLCDQAFHCGLYNTRPEEYEEKVLSFLNTYSTKPTEEMDS